MATTQPSNCFNLQNKTVVITGSGGNIGRILAKRFAELGAKLILFTRQKKKIQEYADSLKKKYQTTITTIEVDFCETEELACTLDTLLKSSHVDILINNAGINARHSAMGITPNEMLLETKVNLIAPCIFMQKVGESMARDEGGSIINIASVKGFEASSDPIYGATKAGLIQMTKTYARELAKGRVKVNAIAPGPIEGNQTEKMSTKKRNEYLSRIAMRRFGTTEEIANIALFLSSEQASYMTGACIMADGGYRL